MINATKLVVPPLCHKCRQRVGVLCNPETFLPTPGTFFKYAFISFNWSTFEGSSAFAVNTKRYSV